MAVEIYVSGWSLWIDDEDEAFVRGHKWHIQSKGYVSGTINGHQVLLHRVLMGAGPDDIVDHKDRDKLNCRRSNLRFVTAGQSARNTGIRKHNRSGFKGVYRCTTTGRWRAETRLNGKAIKLGRFDTAEEAAAAYDAAVKKYHGAYAVTNDGWRDHKTVTKVLADGRSVMREEYRHD